MTLELGNQAATDTFRVCNGKELLGWDMDSQSSKFSQALVKKKNILNRYWWINGVKYKKKNKQTKQTHCLLWLPKESGWNLENPTLKQSHK